MVDQPLPETLSPSFEHILSDSSFTHVVSSPSSLAKSLLPRVAARLDVPALSEVTSIEHDASSNSTTFTRPIYAGNAISTVRASSSIPIKFFTVRSTSFAAAASEESGEAETKAVEPVNVSDSPTEHIGTTITKSERPDLGVASRVISLYPLADVFGAAVGASRAAVDAGYADNFLQFGAKLGDTAVIQKLRKLYEASLSLSQWVPETSLESGQPSRRLILTKKKPQKPSKEVGCRDTRPATTCQNQSWNKSRSIDESGPIWHRLCAFRRQSGSQTLAVTIQLARSTACPLIKPISISLQHGHVVPDVRLALTEATLEGLDGKLDISSWVSGLERRRLSLYEIWHGRYYRLTCWIIRRRNTS
ncbi:hypothetical protein C8J56DRAFT_884718 [Mycena floridula]|nr:hypothetical protein C8J56DRAFT_884718 [Mycena floridula]